MAATEDLTQIKHLLINTDVIESCTRERANTKWKAYKLTNAPFFAALRKEFPMVCKIILPDVPFKYLSVQCLTFEANARKPYSDNLGLFRALAWHLHGDARLEEEIPKLFILYLKNTGGTDPASFRGVCREDIAAVEDNFWADVFLYDFDFVDGSMSGELGRRIAGKHSITVRLLRYRSHIC